MKQKPFKDLAKLPCKKSAFKYLQEKQKMGSKGKSIKYNSVIMQNYLLPQANMTIKDQRAIFSLKGGWHDFQYVDLRLKFH